jgi:hypothetical protein
MKPSRALNIRGDIGAKAKTAQPATSLSANAVTFGPSWSSRMRGPTAPTAPA